MAKKILVVDDDTSHRMMIKAVLTDQGYDIEEAEKRRGGRLVR